MGKNQIKDLLFQHSHDTSVGNETYYSMTYDQFRKILSEIKAHEKKKKRPK